MAFGATEAGGLLGLTVVIAVGAGLARHAYIRRRLHLQARGARLRLEDIDDRERINALRLRDPDAWIAAENERRARREMPLLDAAEAKRRQWDPEYEFDRPAPNLVSLSRRRRQVAEAAKKGEEIPDPEDAVQT
jgi:hypothetical protein